MNRPRFWWLALTCVSVFVGCFALPSYSQSTSEIESLIQTGQTGQARDLIDSGLAAAREPAEKLQLLFLRGLSYEKDNDSQSAANVYLSASDLYTNLDANGRTSNADIADAIARKLTQTLVLLKQFDLARSRVGGLAVAIPKADAETTAALLVAKINERESIEAEKEQIRQRLEEWEQAFGTANESLLRQVFSSRSDFSRRLDDPRTIEEMRGDTVHYTIRDVKIRVSGDTAVVDARMDVVVNGVQRQTNGRNRFVFVKENGQWKLLEL